ncbi:WhiB family transcriptional regulator [Kitasatospora sp. NPDC004723]|uniref:WhiB family transcriptional regulator n=1 Tax=Kitasatospora sp. NPDC004723 TaxID=3154288 RepID=UPI0033A230F7
MISLANASSSGAETSYRAHPADVVGPCATVDPDLFHPSHQSGSPLAARPSEEQALAICADCPLADQVACLRQALAVATRAQQDGVNGGLTRAQRKLLLRDKSKDTAAIRRIAEQLPRQVAAQLGVPVEHAEQLLAAVA